MKSIITRITPILFLSILVVLFFIPVIFNEKTFFAFDCLFQYLPWSFFNDGFQPNNPLITDPINGFLPPHFYPSHYHFKQSVHEGSLHYWFEHNFCGVPFIFYSYPVSYILFSLCPITTAHDVLLFIHILGAGIFAYFYLKKIGLKVLPSLTGAVAWMFNGYVMVWFEFEHVPMLAMTLPATLFCIELWCERSSGVRFVALLCALSLSLCTAYAHLIIFQMLFIGCYILWKIILRLRNRDHGFKSCIKSVLGLLFSVALSAILSANFIISHIELLKTGQRASIPYHDLFQVTGQLPVKYLSTMLFPDVFGSPAATPSSKLRSFTPRTDKRQAYNNYNELCIYIGILTLFLALAGGLYFRENKYILLFSCTAILSLLMAMGCIIYYPLAVLIPGLNLSTPTRILYLFGFSLSMLSGLGAQIFMRTKFDRRRTALILWITILLISIGLVVFLQTDMGIKWAVAPYYLSKWKALNLTGAIQSYFKLTSFIVLKPLLIIFVAFILLVSMLFANNEKHKSALLFTGLILLSYDLISFGRIYNTASPKTLEFPKTPAIEFLKKDSGKYRILSYGKFMHHGFTPFGIEDIKGYGSFFTKRYADYIYKSQAGLRAGLPKKTERWIAIRKFGSPLLDILNTKYILTDKHMHLKSSRLNLVYDQEIKIYRNLNAFERVFFVKQVYAAKDDKDAYMTLGKFTIDDFQKKVILESLPSLKMNPSVNHTEEKVKAIIKTIKYASDNIILEVTSHSDGLIVIGDNYHPDWHAYVDGKETEVLRANYIMRAIPVKAGVHSVSLTFKPRAAMTGWWLTVTGWIIVFFISLIILVRLIYKKYIDTLIQYDKTST